MYLREISRVKLLKAADEVALAKRMERGNFAKQAFYELESVPDWQQSQLRAELEVGRSRYGLMCGEDGMVFDDGVTTRLGPNHFLMTTTTGGAARVLSWLESWLQTEWPQMRVYCTSVTEQFAVVAVTGPLARRLLAELTDIDLDPAGFPFMSFRDGDVAGIPARVYRITGPVFIYDEPPSWRSFARANPFGLLRVEPWRTLDRAVSTRSLPSRPKLEIQVRRNSWR